MQVTVLYEVLFCKQQKYKLLATHTHLHLYPLSFILYLLSLHPFILVSCILYLVSQTSEGIHLQDNPVNSLTEK